VASIRISGSAAGITTSLRRVAALGRNPQPVLEALGRSVVLNTRHRMERGVDPGGNPWVPLNPIYALTKEGPGILRGPQWLISGLYRSITSQARGNVLLWGSNKEYAAIHQFGGVIRPKDARALHFWLGAHEVMVGSVRIPARPYLGFTEEDRTDFAEELDAFIARAFRG